MITPVDLCVVPLRAGLLHGPCPGTNDAPNEPVVLSVLARHGSPSNATHAADPVALRRAVGAVPGLTTSIHTNRVDRRKPRMWYGLCFEPLSAIGIDLSTQRSGSRCGSTCPSPQCCGTRVHDANLLVLVPISVLYPKVEVPSSERIPYAHSTLAEPLSVRRLSQTEYAVSNLAASPDSACN